MPVIATQLFYVSKTSCNEESNVFLMFDCVDLNFVCVCVSGRSELSVEKSSVLQAELQSCNQLLELEPQNKCKCVSVCFICVCVLYMHTSHYICISGLSLAKETVVCVFQGVCWQSYSSWELWILLATKKRHWHIFKPLKWEYILPQQ